jgi:CSLREA domain-containing protein
MILRRTATSSKGVHHGTVLALVAFAGVWLGQQPVRAATITVNSTADDTVAQDGQCTLREAIANVNAGDDTSGGDCAAGTGSGDTIVFSSSLTLPATITLTTQAELQIDSDVTINGPTTGVLAVDGNAQVDVFDITNGTISITNLTIQNGLGSDGGGIYNDATLSLTNCTLKDNWGDDGAGLYNDFDGTATLTNCTLSGNWAPDDLGGGGIYNDGVLTLTDCTLNGNSGEDGGGVYNDFDGTATLTNCALSGNSAPDDLGGGGVYNDGVLALTGCTLDDNSGADGGGVYNDFDGEATLTNCTLSGNSATGGDFGGGGLYNDGTVELTNCTLNGNSAPANSGGGLYNDIDGTATLINTIVANSPSGQNCAGTGVEEGDHNLSSDTTCFSSPDLLSTDPHLAPLADYGAPTATLALCTAEGSPDPSCSGPSPAIDAGDDAVTGPPFDLATDQRGLPRKWGLHVDIGAYEAQEATVLTCVGDCDGNGQVAVDEILTMVNIALGNAGQWVCEIGDSNKDDLTTVDEILTAVNNALSGCGGNVASTWEGPPGEGR